MNTHPTNQYLNRERLTDFAQFAVPDGHNLWPRIERAARTSAPRMAAPRPGMLSLGLSRAWTAVGILFIAATFAALGFGLAVLVLSNGHDQVPAAPVTPTPAAVTASPTPAPVSLSSQVLPSTFDEYRRLAELNPAGREAMFEKAVEDLSEEIRIDPTNIDAYVKRGVAYTVMHYYSAERDRDESLLEQPLADFAKAIDLDPANADAYIGRGEAYYLWRISDKANQDFDTAIRLLSKAISTDSDDVDAYIARAFAYTLKRDSDRAIQDLNTAISLDPGNPEIYYARALAYSQKGEDDKAIQDYDMVILLDPNHVHAYNNRASKYRQKDDLDRAIQDYDKIISLNPNFRWAYGNRGDIYNTKGEYDRAIEDFDKAIAIRPYTVAYRGRAAAYYYNGEYDRAIEDYDIAIDRHPSNPRTYIGRGDAYYGKGEYDRAIEDYQTAIGLDANISDAYYGSGLAHASLGNVSKAREDFSKALELGHDSDEIEAALKELDSGADPTTAESTPTPESWVSENGLIQFTTGGDDAFDDPLPGTHQWCIHPSNAPKEPTGPWLVPTKLPEGMEQTVRNQLTPHSVLRAFQSATNRISMSQGVCATRKLNPVTYRAVQVGDRTAYVVAAVRPSADGSTPEFDPSAARSLVMDIGHGVVGFSAFGAVPVDELVAMAASLVPEEITDAKITDAMRGPYPQAALGALGTGFGPIYIPSKLPDGYEMLGQLVPQPLGSLKTSRISYVRTLGGDCAFYLTQAARGQKFRNISQTTVEIDGITLNTTLRPNVQPAHSIASIHFQSQDVWFEVQLDFSPDCSHSLEMVAEIATSLQPLQP